MQRQVIQHTASSLRLACELWGHALTAAWCGAAAQYEGSPARRAELAARAGRADVVVMSYETLRADVDWAAARPWAYCVLDEGHIIRNPKSKLAQARRHTRPLPGLMFYPLPA